MALQPLTTYYVAVRACYPPPAGCYDPVVSGGLAIDSVAPEAGNVQGRYHETAGALRVNAYWDHFQEVDRPAAAAHGPGGCDQRRPDQSGSRDLPVDAGLVPAGRGCFLSVAAGDGRHRRRHARPGVGAQVGQAARLSHPAAGSRSASRCRCASCPARRRHARSTLWSAGTPTRACSAWAPPRLLLTLLYVLNFARLFTPFQVPAVVLDVSTFNMDDLNNNLLAAKDIVELDATKSNSK